jgi:protocatechuate 3,4-dioxygenase beta subunit
MKARTLLKRGVIGLVLGAALVLLLINMPDPADEATGPDGVQTVENPSQRTNPQSSSKLLHPVEQGTQETAVALETVEANDQQPAPLTKPSGQPATNEPASEENGPFSISGMVVDEAGRSIYGIEVLVSAKSIFVADDHGERNEKGQERQAFTDGDGFYEIPGVADGEYRVRTLPDDLYEAAQAIVRAGAETADLVLREWQPDVAIIGTVRSIDGEPLDSVEVLAIGQSGETAYTDQDGSYEFVLKVRRNKPNYTLQFVRDGYREKRSVLEVPEMERRENIRIDTELEPTRELVEVSGTVHNKNGKPVSGEAVQLYSEDARQRYTAVSDRNGEVWFEEVETSSDYSVSVHPADSYRDFSIQGVEITLAGNDLEVVLEPLARGSLTGQMVDPNGQPIPEFTLWLRNPDAVNQPVLAVTGDSQGFFAVDEIEEGDLIFESRSSPQYSISGINLSAGEKTDVNLVLDWGSHQVTGLLVDDTGRPIAASELFVTSLRRSSGLRAHAVRRAVTDEAGYFLFTQVGPGYHTIRVEAPGFDATILDHDVGVDTPEVIIRLERASSHGM